MSVIFSSGYPFGAILHDRIFFVLLIYNLQLKYAKINSQANFFFSSQPARGMKTYFPSTENDYNSLRRLEVPVNDLMKMKICHPTGDLSCPVDQKVRSDFFIVA